MICIFCGHDRPDSQEHVFPEWMAEEFSDLGVIDYSATYENAGQGHAPIERTWAGKAFTHTVGGICQGCNNGWMSQLEAAAKPVLLGPMKDERTSWSLEQQWIAATWALKTVLVAGLATPDMDGDVVPPEFYRAFGENQEQGPERVVWVGRYDGAGRFPTGLHMAGAYLTPADAGPPPPGSAPSNAFHATLLAGSLAFRVVGHALPGADIGEPRPARSWTRIEPSGGPVRWPPPETMTEAELREAVKTFPGDDRWMNQRLGLI